MPVLFPPASGGALPALDNPAAAAQIMAGYQAIAADGSVIDGTGLVILVGEAET